MLGLGFACISKSLKENGRFRTMSAKTYRGLKPEERIRRLRSISVDNFIDFEDYIEAASLVKDDFDIMMECKEKDLAVLDIIKISREKKLINPLL